MSGSSSAPASGSATSPPTARRPPISAIAAAKRALADAELEAARHRPHHRRDLDARPHLSRDGGDRSRRSSASTQGAAFDLQAVCSGFVYALATADNFLKSGQHKRALVIGAETFSRILDWEDRTTCVLFGDGAGAVVLEAQRAAQGTSDRSRHARPRTCARTAVIRISSMSMAARLRQGRSAICAWKGARCSAMRSRISPT